MKTTFKTFIAFIAVFCVTCRNQEKTIKIILDNGDYIIAPYVLKNKDTLLNGAALSYRSNGQLQSRVSYDGGKKNGIEINYDSSGKVESKISFRNGLEEGYGYFYRNGTLEQQVYYRNGKVIYAQQFNRNGSTQLINIFNIGFQRRDSLDYVQYVVKFDSLGKQTFEGGYVFSPNFFYSVNKDSIKVNTPFEIQFVATILPYHKTVIKMGVVNPNGSLNKLEVVPLDNYYARYQRIFTDTGKKTLVTVGELYDTLGKLIKKDSMIITATVQL